MTEETKQNMEANSPSGLDMDRLKNNKNNLKTAQEAMAPKTEGSSWLSAAYMLNIAFEFAVILAVPLIAAVFIGRWLEAKYHNHIYSILSLVVALVVSAVGIAVDIKKLSKKVKKS